MWRLHKRRWWLLAAVLLAAAPVAYVLTHNVRIYVSNKGDATMQDVRLQVNGEYYALGNIPPEGTASVLISPTSAPNPGTHSQVALEFADDSGQKTRLEVDTYLTPEYRGNIEVEVSDSKIIRIRRNLGLFVP